MRRHLAESRRENDDLLNAVAYLRNKLDTMTATSEDPPTNLHTNDNSDVTTSTDVAVDAADADDDENYEDDDETWGQSSPAELRSHNSK